jgi:hypothetical protein
VSRVLLLLVATLPVFAGCDACAPSFPVPSFEEMPVRGFSAPVLYGAEPRPTILEVNGPGVALFDADGDGDMDLWIGQGSTIERAAAGRPGAADRFLLNEGDGRYRNATEAWGLDQRGWSQGVAVADVDMDGDRDLYVTNWGPNRLLRNDGGRFTDVSQEAGVADPGWGTSAAFGDADGDGDPDLYIANYLRFDVGDLPGPRPGRPCRWKRLLVSCGPKGLTPTADRLLLNRGDGSFEDASERVRVDRPAYGLGVLWADLNGDGHLDIFVANDSAPNFLFENRGDGHFTERGLFAGVSLSADGKPQAGMGVALGDPDGDGDPDLLLTHFSDDHHTLYRNLGRGIFEDASFPSGLGAATLPSLGWGVGFADFDLDGDEDLFSAHGHVYPGALLAEHGTAYAQRDHLYLNDGEGRFSESGQAAGIAGAHVARAAAFGDIDDDGDTDIVEMRLDGPPVVLRNRGAPGRHWLRVRLLGPAGNPDGVGSRVRITAGGKVQTRWVTSGGSFQAVSDPRPLFGLGEINKVERLEVRWPGGGTSRVDAPEVDEEVVVRPPTAAGSSE